MCSYTDWLDEECGNMAREGLRTLVVAKKPLAKDQYEDFASKLNQAKLSMQDRNSKVRNVIEALENELEVIGLTGVEDKLQMDVRPTLESIRNAGIKVSPEFGFTCSLNPLFIWLLKHSRFGC